MQVPTRMGWYRLSDSTYVLPYQFRSLCFAYLLIDRLLKSVTHWLMVMNVISAKMGRNATVRRDGRVLTAMVSNVTARRQIFA